MRFPVCKAAPTKGPRGSPLMRRSVLECGRIPRISVVFWGSGAEKIFGKCSRKFSKRRRPHMRLTVKESTRLPGPIDGIQVNTCRNAACPNFGVEPLLWVDRGSARLDGTTVRDLYRIVGSHSASHPRRHASLTCTKCGSQVALKSNLAINRSLIGIPWQQPAYRLGLMSRRPSRRCAAY